MKFFFLCLTGIFQLVESIKSPGLIWNKGITQCNTIYMPNMKTYFKLYLKIRKEFILNVLMKGNMFSPEHLFKINSYKLLTGNGYKSLTCHINVYVHIIIWASPPTFEELDSILRTNKISSPPHNGQSAFTINVLLLCFVIERRAKQLNNNYKYTHNIYIHTHI